MRSCTGVDRAGLVLLLVALLCPGPWAEARTMNYSPFPRPEAGYGPARDRDAGRIKERQIAPRFRQGRYAEGITSGVKALRREFGGTLSVPRWVFWAIAGTIAFLIPVAISLFRNGKRSWGWIVLGLILVLVLAVVWLGRRVAERTSDGAGEPGGLGRFGGGFSRGGGATGSW